jgi:hypothetical protein
VQTVQRHLVSEHNNRIMTFQNISIWYHKGQTSPLIETSLVSPVTHLLRLKIAPGTQSSAAEPAVESVADSVAESAESSSAAALSALRLRDGFGFGGRSFL